MTGSVYKHKCPDCGHAIRVRNSEGLSELVRACYLQCTNVGCGATYRATYEITHRLSPPAVANPSISLPMADWAMRKIASQSHSNDSETQMDFDHLLHDTPQLA